MGLEEDIKTLERLYAQLYNPVTGTKKTLTAKRHEDIYEQYCDLDRDYEFSLGEEARPEYGFDELNDLLDDVGVALA